LLSYEFKISTEKERIGWQKQKGKKTYVQIKIERKCPRAAVLTRNLTKRPSCPP